jgi:hypothetical protein
MYAELIIFQYPGEKSERFLEFLYEGATLNPMVNLSLTLKILFALAVNLSDHEFIITPSCLL